MAEPAPSVTVMVEISLAGSPTPKLLLEAEKTDIISEKPIHNTKHNGGVTNAVKSVAVIEGVDDIVENSLASYLYSYLHQIVLDEEIGVDDEYNSCEEILDIIAIRDETYNRLSILIDEVSDYVDTFYINSNELYIEISFSKEWGLSSLPFMIDYVFQLMIILEEEINFGSYVYLILRNDDNRTVCICDPDRIRFGIERMDDEVLVNHIEKCAEETLPSSGLANYLLIHDLVTPPTTLQLIDESEYKPYLTANIHLT